MTPGSARYCSYVYFVVDSGAVDGEDAIKIGHAAYPWGRLRDLQTGNPRHLSLLRVIRVFGRARREANWRAATLENELHARFAQFRICGEWFRSVDAINRYATENGEQPGESLGPDTFCTMHSELGSAQ